MTFADILRATAGRRRQPVPPAQHPEPLAALDYAEELAIKQQALGTFWQEERLPGRPERIVPAPVPRGYRTTSKRRAAFGVKGLTLSFPGASDRGRSIMPSAGGLAASVLDCPEHTAVYAFLIERIGRPVAQPLAVALNWVIVRGSAGGLAVILNVRVFDSRVVRAAKLLAEALQAETSLGVRAGFLYLDPTRSEYYLEADRPADGLSFKRLFGPDFLQIDSAGVRLRFPPTAFSQVNSAMLPVMVENVRSLLAPLEGHPLLDLYCGYGLFSLTVGREAAQVVGVDLDGPAIEAARANATHLACARRVHFLAGRIDGPYLAERLRAPRTPEAILLDPPRQGTEPGVAPALAARAPSRVVHLCCGTEEIPREIEAWSRAGYELQRVVSLDLFAGTTGLETLLLLTPKPQPAPAPVPAARPTRPATRPSARPSAPPPTRPSARPSAPPPTRPPAPTSGPPPARPRRGRPKG